MNPEVLDAEVEELCRPLQKSWYRAAASVQEQKHSQPTEPPPAVEETGTGDAVAAGKRSESAPATDETLLGPIDSLLSPPRDLEPLSPEAPHCPTAPSSGQAIVYALKMRDVQHLKQRILEAWWKSSSPGLTNFGPMMRANLLEREILLGIVNGQMNQEIDIRLPEHHQDVIMNIKHFKEAVKQGSRSRSPPSACKLDMVTTIEDYEYFQDGDIIIGGVFTVNFFMTAIAKYEIIRNYICLRPVPLYYRYLLTFFFAIEEINQDQTILPNVSLGYHVYDSCADNKKAVKSVLQILSGPKMTVPNYSCTGRRNVAGFIGDQGSSTTVSMAQILALYRYSQISYGATSSVLSDRNRYPSFYRTIESFWNSYMVLSKLIRLFRWTWVGIVLTDDESGNEEIQVLTQYLTMNGVCVAYTIKVKFANLIVLDYIERKDMEEIRNSLAQVIIVCGTYSPYLAERFQAIKDVLHDKTLVFGPSFAVLGFIMEHHAEIFNGSLALEPFALPLPDMRSFYQRFQTISHPQDMLLAHIWLLNLHCLTRHSKFNTYHQLMLQREEEGTSQYETALQEVLAEMQRKEVPESLCSDHCLPGTRKVSNSRIYSCCYDCVQCSPGEISNTTDSETCLKCSDLDWPNEKKDRCVPKLQEFLSYTDDTIVLVISLVSTTFSFFTFTIIIIFILYQDSAIVKANNRSLSFLLLVCIMLSFLCVFLFLGRPVDLTCVLRQVSFGILFSVAVSSVLAKTIMVCIAFKATKPGSSWKLWIGRKWSNSLVIFCSSIQVMICMGWLILAPPFSELDTLSYQGKITVQCNEGSVIGFYSVLGYMGVLAAVSFLIAFLARTLPDSFNEAKYITFSMLVFCSVWIAMIPAYLSTKGKYMVAVEIFAILTSSAGLLGCIFFPKCYIILWRPELNSRTHLLGKSSKVHF
ncbi:vomeronasal type-2 receptor 26-like [Ranitomeya imitator]|uniref:vomeronasal type-2 receptor 26-like n=1 Tax=Ranitomeya imitator TaxID=111125 RepID=UPI0037E84920